MSYLEESEHDDTASRARRSARAARPAWDAATYGRPDDMRRVRRPPPDEPEPYQGPAYPDSGYADSSYADSSYADSGYADSSYADSTYADRPLPSYAGSAYSDYSGPPDSSGSPPSHGPYLAASDPYPYPDHSQTAAEPAADPSRDYLPRDYPPDDSEAVGMDGDATDRYPGGRSDAEAPPTTGAAGKGRAGRNLPAAIGVGVGLGGVALASLFLWPPAFLALIAVAVGIAIWELVRAIRISGANPPAIPLIAGGALMSGLAWWGGGDALTFGLVVTVLAVMVWRLADGVTGYARDVSAATLVAAYVPFLAGFAALLATAPDGNVRVLVMLAVVVLSDTGGYVAGVRFGRHPMAPSVSPKKSWEGLAGSLVAASVGGALMLFFLFDVAAWWGALFGVAVAGASVLGDLAESMVKRDLGVKDMSSLLPGHGGLMDRLDSIIFAAPTAYALFTLLAPAA